MSRPLALSLLAALSGSTYVTPTTAAPNNKTTEARTQLIEPNETSEKQKIMIEARKQVGSEMNRS